MSGSLNSDMRCNPAIGPGESEIDRLLQMAAYYQRLGCINVAVSLRDLAAAKQASQANGGDDEQ